MVDPIAIGGLTNGAQKNAAIYVRRSNDEGKSKSIEEQINECKAVCQDLGLDVLPQHIYSEPEGSKGHWWWSVSEMPEPLRKETPGPLRAELGRVVADMKNGEFASLVVWRTDRLYRDSGVADALLKIMVKHEVSLIASRHDYHIETSTGFTNASSDAVRNREYSAKISEDVTRDKIWKVSKGKYIINPECLGFRRSGKGDGILIVITCEIELVIRVFRMYVFGENGSGPLTEYGIAKILNDEGVQWPRFKHRELGAAKSTIGANDITNTLKRLCYVGRARHKKNVYDCPAFTVPSADGSGRMETVVPLTLWELVQEKLQSCTKTDKRYGSTHPPHLLTGLSACGLCGRRLFVSAAKKRSDSSYVRYYSCSKNNIGRNRCVGIIPNIPESLMDEWVLTQLAPVLMAEIQNRRAVDGRDYDLERAIVLKQEIAKILQRTTSEAMKMLAREDQSLTESVIRQCRVEREALERELAELERRTRTLVVDTVDLSPEAIKGQSMTALRAILQHVVKSIVLTQSGVVVLTRWGTYIVGKLSKVRMNGKGQPRWQMAVPNVADTLTCLSWFSSPRAFLVGRRDLLGVKALNLTDDEILPGISKYLQIPDTCEPSASIAHFLMPESSPPGILSIV